MDTKLIAVIAVVAVAAVAGGIAFAVISNSNGNEDRFDTTANWKAEFTTDAKVGTIVIHPLDGCKFARIQVMFPETVTLPMGGIVLNCGAEDIRGLAGTGDNPLPAGISPVEVTSDVWYDVFYDVPEDTQLDSLSVKWLGLGTFSIKFIRV